jgi:hypothetical protein
MQKIREDYVDNSELRDELAYTVWTTFTCQT